MRETPLGWLGFVECHLIRSPQPLASPGVTHLHSTHSLLIPSTHYPPKALTTQSLPSIRRRCRDRSENVDIEQRAKGLGRRREKRGGGITSPSSRQTKEGRRSSSRTSASAFRSQPTLNARRQELVRQVKRRGDRVGHNAFRREETREGSLAEDPTPTRRVGEARKLGN